MKTYTEEEVLSILKYFRAGSGSSIANAAFDRKITTEVSGKAATELELLRMWHDEHNRVLPVLDTKEIESASPIKEGWLEEVPLKPWYTDRYFKRLKTNNMKAYTQEEVLNLINFLRTSEAAWHMLNSKMKSSTDEEVFDAWNYEREHHSPTGDVKLGFIDTPGRYVVLDDFNGSVNLVLDTDGNTAEFDTFAAAQKEADECQNGVVVQLG